MKFDTAIVQTRFQSPLGSIILAATDQGLAGLWFEGQRHIPQELAPTLGTGVSSLPPEEAVSAWGGPAPKRSGPAVWPTAPDHPVLQKTSQQLAEYFAGQRRQFDVPLDLSYGTAFQQSVWQALLGIARGATASYGEVSARIGRPAAVRAVGSAIGRNPVSIIVPCHRVLGAHGALTGYAGGLERKRALLRLEGILPGDAA
jgi:methylated-DNA-[protein]-cysteine S-methyltransferase